MRKERAFLSLFQQGKELKTFQIGIFGMVLTEKVSIPFSAGQRVKVFSRNSLQCFFPYIVSIPFSAGQRVKEFSPSKRNLPTAESFYPFFSRAKS